MYTPVYIYICMYVYMYIIHDKNWTSKNKDFSSGSVDFCTMCQYVSKILSVRRIGFDQQFALWTFRVLSEIVIDVYFQAVLP